LVVSNAQSYEIPGARTDPAAKLGSDEVRPGNEPAVRHFMDRTVVSSDFCLRWSGTLRIDCGRAVLPHPVCRLPRVVHLHRPWRCGIHPFCFSAPGAALSPTVTTSITAYTSGGRLVSEMPNYWIGATGRYYFPGLYTAVLPMIPGIYAIYRQYRTPLERGPTEARFAPWR